jgi:pimeloyl-ACP methyl ester carboxylesterase
MSARAAFRDQHWATADGLELYARVYEEAGDRAPAVLCLPGLTRNSCDYEDLAAHLATRYRVVCPDLRGRGRSARDPAWQNYQPATYVADLLALLQTLGLRRVAIVGTSLGGLLAMVLASVAPPSVAGVVLNDIGPEIDPVGAERIRSYAGRLPPVRDWAEAVAQQRLLFGAAWPNLSDARWAVLARRAYREDASGTPVLDADPGIGEAVRAAPPQPGGIWPLYGALKVVPTLAIRGALSDILSAATFDRMQLEKPDLVRLTVAGRGHVPLLDEPECLAAIDAFLGRLEFAVPAAAAPPA